MKKQQWVLLTILILILVGIGVSFVFFSQPSKEIEVKILEVHDDNNTYFLNVSVENHQETRGWIDNMYLSTLQGSEIDITGAGVEYLIEPGETKDDSSARYPNPPATVSRGCRSATFCRR